MSKKLTTKDFIEKARKIHGNKYNYSKVNYINSYTKVCIICPEHGEFWQTPSSHLKGYNCEKCAYKEKSELRKSTTEEFIKKATQVHGDKYDYSKENYINSHAKVCIICPEHGEFWQSPYCHLNGNNCPECSNIIRKFSSKKTKTTEEFIKEAKELYGDKYDYSKVNYINSHTKICIIDKEKNKEIFISPTTFLTSGTSNRNYNSTTEEFIEKAKKVHGNKYDYSKVNYVNCRTKICIICPEHGEFWQTPSNHLQGYNCQKCSDITTSLKRLSTLEEFVKKAREVHGDRYDYSKVNYINSHTKVCIICPEHGEFWQTPSKHLYSQGCPKCQNSVLEEEIMLFLEKNNIKYIYQYAPYFLKNGKGKLKIDFYLPEYNIAIECQGIQHFFPVKFYSKKEFEKTKERDIRKYKKCEENNIKILYYINENNFKKINVSGIYNKNNIFTNTNEILDYLSIDNTLL